MFKDYIVYDNILDEPDVLENFSKTANYFSADGRTIDGVNIDSNETLKPDGGWRGLRSQHLHLLEENLFQDSMNQIILKAFKVNCQWQYLVNAHLQISPGFIEYDDDWWHLDTSSLLAGVIYLNKNPESESGTKIIHNGNEIDIENVYNRLLLYRSDLMHRPTKCFGDDIENSRRTFVFFIENLYFFR